MAYRSWRASVILIHPFYIPAPEPAEHIHQASCGHAVLIVRPHIIIPLVSSILILFMVKGKILPAAPAISAGGSVEWGFLIRYLSLLQLP